MSEGIEVVRSQAVAGRRAPNRTIYEYVSAAACGAEGVTLRIVEMDPPERSGPRSPHTHPYEETIYILEGEGEAWVEGRTYPVRQGEALLLAANHRHMLRNTGTGVLKLACFFPSPEIDSDTVERPLSKQDGQE